MARDSQAALVALNRFGLGARGGASGDFLNAASDPRGCVKRAGGESAGGERVSGQRRGEADAGIDGLSY